MGLDCYIESSKLNPEELLDWLDSPSQDSPVNRPSELEEIWYGRKTHGIFNYLLSLCEYSDGNCEYINIDHIPIEDLQKTHFKESVELSWFEDANELEEFKALIDSIEAYSNSDNYLYLFAWY